jgi:phenylpropionate dioxygenase-like ring-hydroxylating dioxygenase large terminal subunit
MNNYVNCNVFNQSERLVEGWYWALKSSDLAKGQAKPLHFLGVELAIFRGESGKVIAMDAFCPHMGAHLAEGRVEGDSLRCLFHYWKFDETGTCTEIPCLPKPVKAPVQTWPVEERYGFIWIYTGKTPQHPVPFVPELENSEVASWHGGAFTKNCHPHVVMINAIDAQHFASVHDLPVKLSMEPTEFNEQCLLFSNSTKVPTSNFLLRFIGKFYSNALTYSLSYWYGSNGTVTLGPDFFHFHIMFALRPTADGKTEGQTLLITKKRSGLFGKSITWVALFLTLIVGKYFAKGDTKIFRTIQFGLKHPLALDSSIMRFIQHVEKQTLASWGFARQKLRGESK